MPTYQYRCTNCGTELEVVQKFTDPSLTDCEECDGALRKVYSPVGVVFKGSGFYATDNRTKGKTKAATGSTSTGTTSSSGSGSEAKAATSSSSTTSPAPAASAASTS